MDFRPQPPRYSQSGYQPQPSRQAQKAQQQRQQRQKALRFQRMVRILAIALCLALSIAALAQSCATKKAISDLAAQLREKKLNEAQAALMAAQATPEPSPSAAPAVSGTQVKLSFVGEVSMGIDDNLIEQDKGGDRFRTFYEQNGENYFFQNVKSVFEGDDLTTASLCSALTLSADSRINWDLAFRADPSYGTILTAGGIDAVTMANEHSFDFDNEGYVDTLANLDNCAVGRFGYDNTFTASVTGTTGTVTVSPGGITVGLVGVYEKSDDQFYEEQALTKIQELKDDGVQIIVVEISWDTEEANVPDDPLILRAHKLIDAGADLIIGIQPDILQGIELYHGKYIVYSLGTFLTCADHPATYDSLIFQQTFTVSDGQVQPEADYELIPCSVSSTAGDNTCTPTVATGDQADRILNHIYDCSALLDGGISPKE